MRGDGTATARRRRAFSTTPYGEIVATDYGAPLTNRLFTGYLRLGAKTGFYYAGARFYSARLGRFASADVFASMDNPQGLNRYSYVQNDPMNATDPTGMYAIGIECASGCPLHPEHPGFEYWAYVNHPEWFNCDRIFGGCSADFPDWTGDAGEALEDKWTKDPLVDWRNFVPIGNVHVRAAQGARLAALAAAAVSALDLAEDIDIPDIPCFKPFACGSGSTTLAAETDNNGNPLPSGATKLKGDQGYKLPDGTSYKPLRVGETGNHGETGHQENRSGQYRNVKVNDTGEIVPVPGTAGEWHNP